MSERAGNNQAVPTSPQEVGKNGYQGKQGEAYDVS